MAIAVLPFVVGLPFKISTFISIAPVHYKNAEYIICFDLLDDVP